MAKLITIHGTNAGAEPDEGSSWWQKGSAFQERLAELIDLHEVVPYHWAVGANSEAQRRSAGVKLLKLLRTYEKEGTDYHIIGHSHGGSVAYHALLASTRGRRPLARLKSWTTVGTPFLGFERSRFLFNRIGPASQAVFIWALCVSLLGLALLIAPSYVAHQSSTGILYGGLGYAAVGLFVYAFLRTYEALRARHYRKSHRKRCATWYATSWRGICHAEDEALASLHSVSRLGGRILPRSFLVPAFSLTPMVIIPILLVHGLVMQGGMAVSIDAQIFSAYGIALFTILAFAFFAMWLILYLAVILSQLTGYLLGIPLSSAINASVWSHLRSAARGEDVRGEYVTTVEPTPSHFPRGGNMLPVDVAQALVAFTSAHSPAAIYKARKILALRNESGLSSDLITEISAALSWNELLHTAYFEVPEFIRFLAIILSDAGVAPARHGAWTDADRQRTECWVQEWKRNSVPDLNATG